MTQICIKMKRLTKKVLVQPVVWFNCVSTASCQQLTTSECSGSNVTCLSSWSMSLASAITGILTLTVRMTGLQGAIWELNCATSVFRGSRARSLVCRHPAMLLRHHKMDTWEITTRPAQRCTAACPATSRLSFYTSRGDPPPVLLLSLIEIAERANEVHSILQWSSYSPQPPAALKSLLQKHRRPAPLLAVP